MTRTRLWTLFCVLVLAAAPAARAGDKTDACPAPSSPPKACCPFPCWISVGDFDLFRCPAACADDDEDDCCPAACGVSFRCPLTTGQPVFVLRPQLPFLPP